MQWGDAPGGDQACRLAYEAYLFLFFGAIDGDLDPAEKTAIRRILRERAGSDDGAVDAALKEAAAHFDSLRDNASRADSLEMVCRVLGDALPGSELHEIHENCVNVACADGRFHDREAKLLAAVKESWRI